MNRWKVMEFAYNPGSPNQCFDYFYLKFRGHMIAKEKVCLN